jgi:hypothetical protein
VAAIVHHEDLCALICMSPVIVPPALSVVIVSERALFADTRSPFSWPVGRAERAALREPRWCRRQSAVWHESPGIVIQRSLAARGATHGQPWRVFIAADQRLDGVDEVLHPLFEAAIGPVGRIEDAGQVLEPVGGVVS